METNSFGFLLTDISDYIHLCIDSLNDITQIIPNDSSEFMLKQTTPIFNGSSHVCGLVQTCDSRRNTTSTKKQDFHDKSIQFSSTFPYFPLFHLSMRKSMFLILITKNERTWKEDTRNKRIKVKGKEVEGAFHDRLY